MSLDQPLVIERHCLDEVHLLAAQRFMWIFPLVG